MFLQQASYTPSIGGFGLMLEEKLMVLARPFLKDPLAVQAKLCRRMERFIKELFVFVSDPAVPSDNNAAERSLRHLVTSRKISGGTRSGQGTDSKMTLASLFGTWRARGLNPLLECRRLLTSPQLWTVSSPEVRACCVKLGLVIHWSESAQTLDGLGASKVIGRSILGGPNGRTYRGK